MKIIIASVTLLVTLLIGLIAYSTVGTSYNVNTIKKTAPAAISEKDWTIVRCDGYQFGSWSHNGGTVYYSVFDNKTGIRQEVGVSSWYGELQFWYNGDNYNIHAY